MREEFKPDFYQTLGVAPNASQEDIREAYRRLVKKYHPDADQALGTSFLFRKLQEAYEVLSDPERRSRYDQWLRERGLYPEAPLWVDVLVSHRILPRLEEPQAWYVLLTTRTGTAEAEDKPLNICVVIDRSTSMKGLGLEKALEAAQMLIESLQERDVISVVTFNDRAEVVLPASRRPSPKKFRRLLKGIVAEGGTEMARGLTAGLSELLKGGALGAISHMILLTDGNTYGDEEQCLRLAEEAGARGIPITAIGLGTAWNEELLDALALKSGGVSIYLRYPQLLPSTFTQRVKTLRSALSSSLAVEFTPLEGADIKGAFRLDPGIERLALESGPAYIGPAQNLTRLFLEMVIPPLSEGEHMVVSWLLRDVHGSFRVVGQTGPLIAQVNRLEEVPAEIREAAEKVAIFKLREKAWRDIKAGDKEGASRRLKLLATRLSAAGERSLATLASTEALKLARTGELSPEGKKGLLYGTRFLALPPSEEGE